MFVLRAESNFVRLSKNSEEHGNRVSKERTLTKWLALPRGQGDDAIGFTNQDRFLNPSSNEFDSPSNQPRRLLDQHKS